MTLSSIWGKVKEIIQSMLGMNRTLEQTLHIAPLVSNKMVEAIELWTDMYEDNAEWLHEPTFSDPTMVVSLGLPSFIASEKARMAVLEFQSAITAPMETEEVDNPEYFPPVSDMFGNYKISDQPKTIIKETPKSPVERAEFMDKQYQDKLIPRLRTQLEYGIAKGSLIIKPYVVKSKLKEFAGVDVDTPEIEKFDIEFDFIQADCFYPLSFDNSGKLTEVAFIQTKTDKDMVYTRLEYHKLSSNTVTISSKAYETTLARYDNVMGNIDLGKEIPLKSVPEWKDIPPVATVKNVDRLLFGYFKMPDANTIDPHSPLGISGFARAEKLIREADKQYSRLLWEYEGGELAIDIDRDALTDTKDFNGNTHTIMGHLQKRLYRPIDLGTSDTYKPYAPNLRDHSLINGLNTILMRIEDVCALSRGTISEVAAEARTATELKILKQRSYASNAEIQRALETALRDAIYTMDVYCSIYNIVNDVQLKDGKADTTKLGQYDVSFTWDDSILVDVETELSKRLTLLQNGLASKEEVRMWYFGESERQAREALAKIKQENQQAIEQNMMVSSQMGKSVQQEKTLDGGNQPNPDDTQQTPTNPDDLQQNNLAQE